MWREYADLTSRLGPPLWWDDNGAPRYELFRPGMLGIYDALAAYNLIRCQACVQRFDVAVSLDRRRIYDLGLQVDKDGLLIFDPKNVERLVEILHYGDPPRHFHNDEGCVGEMMNSELVRIRQFWWRAIFKGWQRMPRLEITIPEQAD